MRIVRAAVVLLAVLLLAAFAFAKLTSDSGPVASTPGFGQGLSNVAVSTSTKIRLSPDSTKVALVESGVVTVVRSRDGARVMAAGKNIVDVAWMPDGNRVIVVEGPIPTGEIDAIDMTGKRAGVAKLKAPIGFGDGFGLAVDSRGTQAAAIAVTRDPIGGARHTDLAVVELQTGAVRIFESPTEERNPTFVDDENVAYLAGSVLFQRELGDGRLTKIDQGFADGPFVAGPDGELALWADDAAQGLVGIDTTARKRRALRVLPQGHIPVDVDAHLTRALVRVTDRDGTVHLSFDSLA